jgi:hypothetical protein
MLIFITFHEFCRVLWILNFVFYLCLFLMSGLQRLSYQFFYTQLVISRLELFNTNIDNFLFPIVFNCQFYGFFKLIRHLLEGRILLLLLLIWVLRQLSRWWWIAVAQCFRLSNTFISLLHKICDRYHLSFILIYNIRFNSLVVWFRVLLLIVLHLGIFYYCDVVWVLNHVVLFFLKRRSVAVNRNLVLNVEIFLNFIFDSFSFISHQVLHKWGFDWRRSLVLCFYHFVPFTQLI